jgi:hypothetical protein
MRRVATALAIAMVLGACASGPKEQPGQASCGPIQNPTAEKGLHVKEGEKFRSSTTPPTSGPHWPRPAPTGYYEVELHQEPLIHNMEHGHVVIWYRPGLDASVKNGLKRVVASDLTRWIMVPYTGFDKDDVQVVFTAWGHMQECTNATSALPGKARAFFRKYAGKGPEGDIPGTPHK